MPKALPVIDTTAPICCSPVASAPMSDDDALEVALRLKALADPVRVRLMSLLLAQDEVCTCDLAPAVNLTEATVSFHLGAESSTIDIAAGSFDSAQAQAGPRHRSVAVPWPSPAPPGA